MLFALIVIIIALFVCSMSQGGTVHLYAGKRPAGDAMHRFQRGEMTLRNAQARKVHYEDVPVGFKVRIHGPLTGTCAQTLKV